MKDLIVLYCAPDDATGVSDAIEYIRENKYTSDFVKIQRITVGGQNWVRVIGKEFNPIKIAFLMAVHAPPRQRYKFNWEWKQWV